MQPNLDREIWLDLHISPIIAKWQGEETGLMVKSAFILKHQILDDFTIYNFPKNNPSPVIFISKGLDLPKLVRLNGAPPKLIFLYIGNCDNRIMYQFFLKNIQEAMMQLINDKADIFELIP